MSNRADRVVEKPPQQYATGPTQTGQTTEKLFDDPFALQAYCHANGVGPDATTRAGQAYDMGCYLPNLDLVVLPTRKAWPSQDEINALRDHEWAHARGWRHNADGRGTSAVSLPPVNMLTATRP